MYFTACNCDTQGSIGITCDMDGKCQCKETFNGQQCNACKEGFYNFPICEACNCDPVGVIQSFAGKYNHITIQKEFR